MKTFFRFTAAAAGAVVIAAVTLLSSVKLAEKIEKIYDDKDKENDEPEEEVAAAPEEAAEACEETAEEAAAETAEEADPQDEA